MSARGGVRRCSIEVRASRIYDYWSDVPRLVVAVLAVDLIDCGRPSDRLGVVGRTDAATVRSSGTHGTGLSARFAPSRPSAATRSVALRPLVRQSSMVRRMVLSARARRGKLRYRELLEVYSVPAVDGSGRGATTLKSGLSNLGLTLKIFLL